MHDLCIIVVEPHESEEEAELSTTHAICLEVKQGDITSSSTHSTVPMAQFAARYLGQNGSVDTMNLQKRSPKASLQIKGFF